MKQINLAIFTPNSGTLTETFIKAHCELLPFEIFTYDGAILPRKCMGIPIIPKGIIKKVIYQIKRKILHKDLNAFEYALYCSLKKNKIDVVLTEYGITGAASLKVVKKLSIPMIIHFHGYDAYEYAILSSHKDLYQEMFEYAKAIFAVSKDMQKQLISLGAPAEKVVLNPYGPRKEFFDIEPDYHSNQLVSVGRFVDKKAPYYLLEVVRRLKERNSNVTLNLIGEGPLLPTCINLSKVMGIDDRVSFLGALPHNKVKTYLEKAVVYLQHSVTAQNGDKEGTPVSILEASAAGLPIVSTKHAGIPDIVIDNETGYLAEEHDIENMTRNVEKLLKDKRLAERMGRNGKCSIKENFSIQAHLKRITEAVNQAQKK